MFGIMEISKHGRHRGAGRPSEDGHGVVAEWAGTEATGHLAVSWCQANSWEGGVGAA